MKQKDIKWELAIMLLTFIFAGFPSISSAQEKGNVAAVIHTDASLSDSEFKPLEFGVDLDYYFTNRFYGGVKVETAAGLFDVDSHKTYYLNSTYGLNVGYGLFHFEKSQLDINVAAGNTFSNKNWKYLYYEGGVYFQSVRSEVRPRIGIGVTYYDSRNKLFDNYVRGFLSIGFSFNL